MAERPGRAGRRSRRPTIADVAASAKVDVSTVSRVLRDDPGQRVSAETRERIVRAARALRYAPNMIALGLRTARTRSIGIVVSQLDNLVIAAMILGASQAARERGYALLIAHAGDGVEEHEVYGRLAGQSRVDGLLAASVEPTAALLRTLEQVAVPAVVLNRSLPSGGRFVAMDNRAAARVAVAHLVALGHRRIAHLAGNATGFNGRQRLRGYRDALAEAGLPFDEALVVPTGYTPEDSAAAMRTLLAAPGPRPTAVFTATPISAAGALSVLHERAIKVPGDMSVVAVHDSPIAEMLHPPLSAVRLPVQEMGRRAAQALIAELEGEHDGGNVVLPPQQLVVRASTGPA